MKLSLRCPTCSHGYADYIGKRGTNMAVYECPTCGTQALATRCGFCGGTGYRSADPCPNCEGGIVQVAYDSKAGAPAKPATTRVPPAGGGTTV